MQEKAHLLLCKSLSKSPKAAKAGGKARQCRIWCLQCKVFAKVSSQWGSPWSFRKEIVGQLTSGHYNKHRKNKIIKQETEEKNGRGLQQCWEPGLRQLHVHFPRSLLETGKHFPTICQGLPSNFLQSQAVCALLIIWKRQNCARPEGLWNRKGSFVVQRLRY